MSTISKQRVGVIFGGLSSEKEVSLATGRYVYSLVDHSRFDTVPLYLSSSRKLYRIPDKLVIQNKTEDVEKRILEEGSGAEEIELEKLKELVDVVFVALLGKFGEDGVIQGILELLGIPYTGSGILASSACMQKRVTKGILENAGIVTPKHLIINTNSYSPKPSEAEKMLKTIYTKDSKFFNPCIVKPSREGSSVGVSYVDSEESFIKAILEAAKYDNEILIEEYIQGTEFMCVVIGNENPVAMLPTEVSFNEKIFTYEGKYMPGRAQYFTPPRNISKEVVQQVRDIAVKSYKALNITGYGRVDGFIKADGTVLINEVHTGTIMVPSSYVFQQAALSSKVLGDFSPKGGKLSSTKAGKSGGIKGAAGLSPRQLVTTIIDLAIDAHSQKKGTLQ